MEGNLATVNDFWSPTSVAISTPLKRMIIGEKISNFDKMNSLLTSGGPKRILKNKEIKDNNEVNDVNIIKSGRDIKDNKDAKYTNASTNSNNNINNNNNKEIHIDGVVIPSKNISTPTPTKKNKVQGFMKTTEASRYVYLVQLLSLFIFLDTSIRPSIYEYNHYIYIHFIVYVCISIHIRIQPMVMINYDENNNICMFALDT